MAKNESDRDKKHESQSGEHGEKSKDERAEDEDRKKERKLPEPPGNLRRRGEWFRKRH